jgi:hypothetical protein
VEPQTTKRLILAVLWLAAMWPKSTAAVRSIGTKSPAQRYRCGIELWLAVALSEMHTNAASRCSGATWIAHTYRDIIAQSLLTAPRGVLLQ